MHEADQVRPRDARASLELFGRTVIDVVVRFGP
jgi:hypothetical protein